MKLGAEDALLNSGLDFTILRPTMIYGTPKDRNMIRLLRYLQRFPIVPVPGSGEFRQQPVHVEDVAQAIVDCIEPEATVRRAYNLSGGSSLTFNEVIDCASRALGVRRRKLHLPLRPTLWAVRALKRMGVGLGIKEEQLLRINEDKCFDHSDAQRDFGFSPRTFAEGIRQEADLWRGSPGHCSRDASLKNGSSATACRHGTQSPAELETCREPELAL
jgi:nucleoside-diphosphate-sugar epimerase